MLAFIKPISLKTSTSWFRNLENPMGIVCRDLDDSLKDVTSLIPDIIEKILS